jgi:hypothetical protein
MDLHTKRQVVLWVFFGLPTLTMIVLALFDIWVYYQWGSEATISHAMLDLPPMVIYTLGFVMGGLVFGLAAHFWWWQK